MNKIWRELYSFAPKKEKKSYHRAKRSKVKLMELDESLGLTIEENWTPGRYGIMKGGNSIHNDYGVRDTCGNLLEVEECIEDYIRENGIP